MIIIATNKEVVLDTRGQLCPKPFIELVKAFMKLGGVGIVKIYTDDETCTSVIPKHAEEVGFQVISIERGDSYIIITVKMEGGI
ncbi:MAG: sulfurtransferase TusA family protein [Desulfurococcales archaeon]|nr:sulfurtransferase TusA family protein [Desulfurococcales archaeon]